MNVSVFKQKLLYVAAPPPGLLSRSGKERMQIEQIGSGREALGRTGTVKDSWSYQTLGRLSGRKRLCGELVCRPSGGVGSAGSIR